MGLEDGLSSFSDQASEVGESLVTEAHHSLLALSETRQHLSTKLSGHFKE